jgi:L-fucose mutarotase
MLKSGLLHPELLRALASAGHGSKLLIADSNYPFNTGKNHDATVVYLNLCPGRLLATEVLQALAEEIPIEAAEVCSSDGMSEPPVFREFRALLPGREITKKIRGNFFEHVRSNECCLIIATGDERPYSSILITIGVVPPHVKQAASTESLP